MSETIWVAIIGFIRSIVSIFIKGSLTKKKSSKDGSVDGENVKNKNAKLTGTWRVKTPGRHDRVIKVFENENGEITGSMSCKSGTTTVKGNRLPNGSYTLQYEYPVSKYGSNSYQLDWEKPHMLIGKTWSTDPRSNHSGEKFTTFTRED